MKKNIITPEFLTERAEGVRSDLISQYGFDPSAGAEAMPANAPRSAIALFGKWVSLNELVSEFGGTVGNIDDERRDWLPTSVAAAYLGRKPSTLYQWSNARGRETAPIKPGSIRGRLMWSTAAVRELIRGRRAP